jgi:hypothetical protein
VIWLCSTSTLSFLPASEKIHAAGSARQGGGLVSEATACLDLRSGVFLKVAAGNLGAFLPALIYGVRLSSQQVPLFGHIVEEYDEEALQTPLLM